VTLSAKVHGAGGDVRALGLAVVLSLAPLVTFAGDLKPGPNTGNTVYLENARDYAFCEFEVVTGAPPAVVVEVYNTSGQVPCLPAQFGPIDAKALAQELGTAMVAKNPTRFWLMDEIWVYDVGETHDFDGVKATWMAKIEAKANPFAEEGKPFPSYKQNAIARNSKFLWKKGSEVYLLKDPDGRTWIMQAYTNLVDRTLTSADLPKLGSKLKLPAGWTYEAKTLDRDFTYIPSASTGHITHAVADDLQNMYQGCGFDDACSYIP
jgi:hypothetical protein